MSSVWIVALIVSSCIIVESMATPIAPPVLSYGGSYVQSRNGTFCLNANIWTGACDCPREFEAACAMGTSQRAGSQELVSINLCSCSARNSDRAFGGLYQIDDSTKKCLTPNAQTGECTCSSAFTVSALPTLIMDGVTNISATTGVCVNAGALDDTFHGVFALTNAETNCALQNTFRGRRSRYAQSIGTERCTCPLNSCAASIDWFTPTALSAVTICESSTRQVPVNADTIRHKLMFGYQQWQSTPRNGFNIGFDHWTNNGVNLNTNGSNAVFDVWPELEEYPSTLLTPTDLTLPDGTVAHIFDAFIANTTELHVSWMRHYGIDGVWLQRFMSTLVDPRFFQARTTGAQHLRAAAERHGRAFAIMYDISGMNSNNLLSALQKDLPILRDEIGIFQSSQYLRDNNKPWISLWGCGVRVELNASACITAIEYVRSQGFLVHGGVPFYWRTQHGASGENFTQVYLSFDLISPWAVGVYTTPDDYINNHLPVQLADIEYLNQYNILYSPVVFPGFSWFNLMHEQSPFNQIPRIGGRFWWSQANTITEQLASMKNYGQTYGAMFDEIDEGTAMYKAAESYLDKPAQGRWLSMDQDGLHLPSDHYFCLAARQTSKLHRLETSSSSASDGQTESK